ncbi:MAG: CAP domain-containing protein [Verrucomicrobiota bacterium]
MSPLRPLLLAAALALGVSQGSGEERPTPDPSDNASAIAPTPQEFARTLLAETNRVRVANHRRPLKSREELAAAADDQAAFMALRLHVQHGSFLPGQASVTERVLRHGLFGVEVAENVASTSLPGGPGAHTAEQVAAMLVAQWMDSPGHRATLLDPRVTHFGGSIRLARLGKQWASYGVQVFLAAPPAHGRVRA